MPMDCAAARDCISGVASVNFERAVNIAESIPDPLYRCQALAIASLKAPGKEQQLVLNQKALESGLLCRNPTCICMASSWPVRALFKLGYDIEGEKAALHLLDLILVVPSPVRRADALNYLLGACTLGSKKTFWQIYDAFFAACTTRLRNGKKNKRGQSLLAGWAAIIKRFDSQRGKELLDSIDGPNYLRNAHRSLERSAKYPTEVLISSKHNL